MARRIFSREFKAEAVRLVHERGVSVAQAARDLDLHENMLHASEQFQQLMADNGVVCSMSRSGNVWDNAAMESFFSSLKTERVCRKVYRSRNAARADVFDYIERFLQHDAPALDPRLSQPG
jgi:transposase InsO family protein